MNCAELMRNVWREFRIVPVFVWFGVGALLYFVHGALSGNISDNRIVAGSLAAFFLFFRATGSVIGSIRDEITEGTWDLQRLSALRPSEIVIGKIVGASITQWLLGGFWFVIYLWSKDEAAAIVIISLGTIGMIGLLSSICFVTLTLSDAQARYRFAGLNFLTPFLGVVGALMVSPFLMEQPDIGPSIRWYGYQTSILVAYITLVLVGALWAFFGACRIVGRELMYRQIPWGGAAAVIFWAAALAGFNDVRDALLLPVRWMEPAQIVSSGAFRGLLAGYLLFFFSIGWFFICGVCEPLTVVGARKWCSAILRTLRGESGAFKESLFHSPSWLGVLPTAAAGIVLLAVSAQYAEPFHSYRGQIILFAVSIFFLVIRDVAVVHIFSFLTIGKERRLRSALLYFVIIWGLLPMMIGVGSWMTALFYPRIPLLSKSSASLMAATPYFLQAIVAVGGAIIAFLRKRPT